MGGKSNKVTEKYVTMELETVTVLHHVDPLDKFTYVVSVFNYITHGTRSG